MEKKIPVKTLYLLFVISFGLIALGVGSTYAIFTASAEIINPIAFTSNLSYSSDIIETVEVKVPAGEIVTTTLNITNDTTATLNYVTWYTTNSEDVDAGIASGSIAPTGTLASSGTTSVNVDIRNSGKYETTVIIGISSNSDSIVLGNNMKEVPNASFTAYAVYSEDDYSLTFYKTVDTITTGSTYNGKTATAVYTGFETANYTSSSSVPWYSYRESITTVSVENVITPVSTGHWFYYFSNCNSMNLTNLDTSSVTTMYYMFYRVGYNVTTFELIGLDNWNTSSVTNMSYMFTDAGYSATEWDIGDLSNWDTLSVTSMATMFCNAGYSATKWDIGDLNNWDTSSVTDMSYMFCSAGYIATEWNIGNLNEWNTSSVTNMSYMFAYAGYKATEWNIGDLSTKTVTKSDGTTYTAWNTSNVTNMTSMFYTAGYTDKDWTLDLSNWTVTNVTNYSNFAYGNTSKITLPAAWQ